MKHDRAMATLTYSCSSTFYKGRKQSSQKLLEEAKRLDDQGKDGGSNKNDERPIENAFYAETHA